jgi:hypothetical protein
MADFGANLPPAAAPPGVVGLGGVASGRMLSAADILANPSLSPSPSPQDASQIITDAQQQAGVYSGQSSEDVNAARIAGQSGANLTTSGASQVAAGQGQLAAAQLAIINNRKANDDEIYSRWGTTPGHPSALIASLSSAIQDEAIDLHQTRQGINQKLSANFLDNPIQWIMNQITVPFELDQLRSKSAGFEQDLEVLSKLRDATREETAQNLATTYPITAATAAATSQIALGEATKTAGEAQSRVAGIGLGVANAGNSIGNTGFTQAVEGLRTNTAVSTADYQKVVNLQEAARKDEANKFQIDMLALNDKDLNKSSAAKDALDQRVQKMDAVIGTNFGSWDVFKALPDSKEKSDLMTMLLDPSIQQGASLNLLGPGEATALANKYHLPLSPGEDMVRKQLSIWTSDYERSQQQLLKTMTPEQRAIGVNDYIKQKIRGELNNVPTSGSIFSPGTLGTVLQMPGMQGTPLADALAPLMLNPMSMGGGVNQNYPLDPKDVIAAANQLIADGKATPAQMGLQVATLYSNLAVNASAGHGYSKFTLPSMQSEGKYLSSIPNERVTVMSPYATHNLMNQAEMQNYFTRSAITSQIQRNMGTAPGMAP